MVMKTAGEPVTRKTQAHRRTTGTAEGWGESRPVATRAAAGRMSIMPKAFPKEFRDDVVAIALKREASFARIAKDFGISESCVQRWVKIAEVGGGRRLGVSTSEAVENRELRRRV